MTSTRRLPIGFAIVLAIAGLAVLYAGPIRTRLLNDDYLFLEEARTQSLAQTLTHPGALPNYYRPLSRQIYFEALAPIASGHPLVFHVANFVLFLMALALLADLLFALLPPAGAMVGCLYFALLPFQRVNLTWVSCSQDLLALAATLATVALFRRGRRGWALVTYLAAIASKEAALPLPIALLAWGALVDGEGLRDGWRRALPFAVLALVWLVVGQAITVARGAPAFTHFTLGHFLAGYVHLVQSLLGIDAPGGLLASFARHAPSWGALLLLAPLALWYEAVSGPLARKKGVEPAAPPTADAGPVAFEHRTKPALLYALVWIAAFGFVTGPVAHTWSSYYYTLAAVGGATLVGLLLRRGDRWSWLLTVSVLLWWHAATTAVPSFAVADRPWGWTSHLTSFYFQRAAAITDSLSSQLKALEPEPPRGSRLFFATLPPWAGFQMGNGALVRDLYRDSTLGSYFYTQFSETTDANRPTRFFYWDGARLNDLYPRQRDPWFQVGSDLLLLDRPAGAAHAFRRGLASGGDRMDLLYWLGWAYLWNGQRPLAERTWTQFGAVEDSVYWSAHLRAAHNALIDGDTLEARRHLIRAIEFGMGRPEGHAVLGELLMGQRPKYGTLELKVATWLKPGDWMARRALALGLASARLDDAARREIEALARIYPEWRSDSTVARAWRTLEGRRATGAPVARFGP